MAIGRIEKRGKVREKEEGEFNKKNAKRGRRGRIRVREKGEGKKKKEEEKRRRGEDE